eukprot:scaffold77606_cov31-Tisochrysis_lutea.AAC.4
MRPAFSFSIATACDHSHKKNVLEGLKVSTMYAMLLSAFPSRLVCPLDIALAPPPLYFPLPPQFRSLRFRGVDPCALLWVWSLGGGRGGSWRRVEWRRVMERRVAGALPVGFPHGWVFLWGASPRSPRDYPWAHMLLWP